jgi:predicted nucleic acid-binding protein
MVKKECVERITDGKRGDSLILTITQRQFLTLLIGQHVENVYHPSGTSWSNRYSWHAAEFVRRQIETLAAELSEEAGEALSALASNKKLLSYRDRLRQAIANYAKIRQQHQYRQPDWDKTAVYTEVVTRGGTRPDALTAVRLIQTGYIRMVDATVIGSPLEELQYYQLGQGESEALTLTARLGVGTVMVTDDFLALIIARRLGTSCQLFLDFVIGRAARGELPLVEAQQVVQAVSSRYPVGFVPHSLAMLRRLQP